MKTNMGVLWSLTVAFALGGCWVLAAEDDSDADTGITTDPTEDTAVTSVSTGYCPEILEFFPADGDPNAYYRTAIEFTLEFAQGTETIEVDQGANVVAGATVIDGNKVTFQADAPLQPNTSYEVTLNWCAGPTATIWTTSRYGIPVDPNDVIGRTYSIDLGSGRFASPAGIGPLIQQEMESPILINPQGLQSNDLQMLIALGTVQDQQDVCQPTASFTGPADFGENPFFDTGPSTSGIGVDIEGVHSLFHHAAITGAFADDGSSIGGVTLTAVLDTRPLVGLVGATGDDQALCDLLVTFDEPCIACDDGGLFCVPVKVDNMQGALQPGLSLTAITPQQAAQNCP